MSKFKGSVHRWLTGILASAMVLTALPLNVFGEEAEVSAEEVQLDFEGEDEGAGDVEENCAVTFEATGVSSINYKVGEGEVQTWTAGAEAISVLKDSSLVVTGVTVSTGYNSDSITVKVGDVEKAKTESSWTIGTIAADTTVTVTAALKAGVSVTALVDTAAPAPETADVAITGLDTDNKTKGEALVLTITPAEDKIIKSVSYAIGTETPVSLTAEDDGTYTVSADAVLTAMDQGYDITVAITTDAKACSLGFSTTGISKVEYTLNGGTVLEWTPGQEAFEVANGAELVITGITTSIGYKTDSVTVKNGESTISKENNKWTVGPINSDTVVNITATLKPGVSVAALVNGQTPSEATALVEFDGLENNKTDGDSVYVTVNPAKNMSVESVSCKVGDGSSVELESFMKNGYVIPQATVLSAMDTQSDIIVYVNLINTDEQVYETKLGLNKKQTSFIFGEGVVETPIDPANPETYKNSILLATAKFSNNTTVKKLGYAEIVDSTGQVAVTSYDGLLLVNDEVRLYRSNYMWSVGKYTLRVYPMTPPNRETKADPAEMTLTGKRPIVDVKVKVPAKVLKNDNKAVIVKPTVEYNYNEKDYAPAVKKVTWQLFDKNHEVVTNDKITLKNGAVTFAKDFELDAVTSNNVFFIRATAADYPNNPEYDEASFEVCASKVEIGSIAIDGVTDLSSELLRGDLLDKRIIVKDKNGNVIDPDCVTVTVNDSKNFKIGSSYGYDEETGVYTEYKNTIKKIDKAGKFTITATATDGGKSSLKQVVKVKAATPATYSVTAFAHYDFDSDASEIIFTNKEASLTEYPSYIAVRSTATSSEDSVLVNNASLSVKGGKKLSTSTDSKGRKYYSIVPTSDTIEITHKYGKGSSAVKETYKIKLSHSKVKVAPASKTYDIWAGSKAQDYTLGFTVSGIEETTAGEYYLKFGYPNNKISDKQSYIYYELIGSLNYTGPVALTQSSDKFNITAELGTYDGIPKGKYNLTAALYKKEGDKFTAVSDNFVVTFNAVKAKAPSVAVDVTDKRPVEVDRSVNSTSIIKFKNYKNASGIYTSSVKVYCNNKNGVVNNFDEYFNIRPVVVNGETVNTEPGTALSNALQLVVKKTEGIDETKDLTGWVKYTVLGEDNTQTVEKIEKITVKFK